MNLSDEIFNYLKEKINLPKDIGAVQSMSLHLTKGEPPMVEICYYVDMVRTSTKSKMFLVKPENKFRLKEIDDDIT